MPNASNDTAQPASYEQRSGDTQTGGVPDGQLIDGGARVRVRVRGTDGSTTVHLSMPPAPGRSRRASRDTVGQDAEAAARSRHGSRELPSTDGLEGGNRPTRRRGGGVRKRRSSKEIANSSTKWQDGEAAFDLPDMRRKRQALIGDPLVADALNAWWKTTDSDGNGEIDRDEYICLGKALYRVMINDGDETAAQKSAENDWAEDSKGRNVMSGEEFRMAIFELADLCESAGRSLDRPIG